MTENKSSEAPKTETQVVKTSAGDVHITQPANKKGHKPKITVLLESDDIVRHQAKGFVNFLQEYAVVGLALGFIVGQQANGVVKQFVASFLDPLSTVWFGQNLSAQAATLHHNHTAVKVPWGAFLYVFIEFFIVLIVIYALIKLFRLDRFTKKDK